MDLSNNHKKKTQKKKKHGSDFVTLIDVKREEEKVNVYEIKFQFIYRETNRKEIALSLLFFILMLMAYKREEIT